jgi:hypothetical protein
VSKKIEFKKWAADLPLDERLAHAHGSLQGTSNVAHFLVRLHETNRIVLYSDTLSRQVPTSYAANAYNNFTRALLEIELVRLCSLWDPARQDAFSIPTVIDLIDGEVVECLARAIAGHYDRLGDKPLLIGIDDEEERRQTWEALKRVSRRDGQEQYDRTRRIAWNTIRLARLVASSKVLKNVRNFRNKNIAHATALTDHERKSGPVPRPKGGDEGRLLHVTLKILERLDLCIRGVLVNWSDSEQIARKDAEALWQGVTIKVLR